MYPAVGSGSSWEHADLGNGGGLLDDFGMNGALLLSPEMPVVGEGLVGGLGSFGDMSSSSQAMRLHGDFYHEADNVKRGVNMMNPGLMGGLDASQMMEPYGHDFDSLHGNWWQKFDSPDKGDMAADVELEDAERPDFTDDVAPAEAPEGGASCSSVLLECGSAAQVASAVHTFLTTEVSSSIRKVRTQKFSIKADVFVEVGVCSTRCTLKARVFRVPGPPTATQLSVEFGRRQGDAVGFQRIFDQAARYLRDRFDPHARSGTAQVPETAPPTPALCPNSAVGESDLGPLLDMVSDESTPLLQAEAVAALAVLVGASAGAAAALAVLARLQEVLAGLLSAELSLAYPAACLAAQLARQGSNGPALAERLLLAAIQGAVADATDGLVRLQLAEVVRLAAPQFAAAAPSSWPASCGTELRGALEKALSAPACRRAEVRTALREALDSLDSLDSLQVGPARLGIHGGVLV